MTDNDEDKNNKDEEKQESSESKPKKLDDTSGLHLGNGYADKFPNSTCFYCPKCKTSFSSKIESELHQCNE